MRAIHATGSPAACRMADDDDPPRETALWLRGDPRAPGGPLPDRRGPSRHLAQRQTHPRRRPRGERVGAGDRGRGDPSRGGRRAGGGCCPCGAGAVLMGDITLALTEQEAKTIRAALFFHVLEYKRLGEEAEAARAKLEQAMKAE